ncbi:MAG: hypothetical protein PWP54_1121 [Thermosipho sp. (in: thermotogales)]|nr:hypothetical protein [Thermosipho sp. (in: thermotogales)]
MKKHKMIQEIYEINEVLEKTTRNGVNKIRQIAERYKKMLPALVLFSGRGSSDNACAYGQYLFQSKLKLLTSSALGSLYVYYKTPPNLKNAMVIGISQSGETKDVNEVLKIAKKENAFTIGITNNLNSTMAKILGEDILYLNAGVEKSVAATKTFVSSLAILLFLTNIINGEDLEINKLKKLVDYVISKEKVIKEIAKMFVFAQDLIVLGTGFNYSIALEGSLKLKETCYINAQGMSTIDFVHGPLAMLEPNIPIIIFAPNDGTQEMSKKVLEKIRKTGTHVLVVSDNKEILEMGDLSFTLLEAEKELYPFQTVMFMYLFSYYLSISKKLNPDEPRFLSKVSKI